MLTRLTLFTDYTGAYFLHSHPRLDFCLPNVPQALREDRSSVLVIGLVTAEIV
jgi:hypothetical protein